MAMLTLGLLMALAADAVPAERLAGHLGRAKSRIERIAVCAGRDPERLEETHFLLEQRREQLRMAAAELFPGAKAAAGPAPRAAAGGCSKAAFAALRDGAIAELDSAQRLIDRALGPERRQGLWMGSVRVCGARSVGLQNFNHSAQLNIRLGPAQAAALRRVTGERVGRTLPVWFNGRVHSAPRVNEPIMGDLVQVSGSPDEYEAMEAAAKAPCS